LSGYLIYGSLMSRRQRYVRFMSRRIERIYPAFIAVFALYLLLSIAFPAENRIPAAPADAAVYLVENLLLLPGLFPISPMIGVAWSLSYEMFYYLAIPGLVALLILGRWNTGSRTMLFVTVAGATALYCAFNDGHVRLILFLSGMLLFEAMSNPRIPTPGSWVGLLALAAGLLSTLLPVEGFAGTTLKVSIRFVSFFILGLACFRNPSAGLSRALSWTPLRWLGNMSYSYYLIHGVTLAGAFMALSLLLPGIRFSPWTFWGLLAATFALTLLPSAALFLLVERPFSLVPRRAGRGDRAAVLQAASGTDAQEAARRLP
jgi:peptidoglycan/LPS O-acetylase OafA/YrhL